MRVAFVSAVLAVLGTTALAQTMPEDTDGDGVYSMDEMKAAFPDVTDEVLVQIDLNEDGSIDIEELAVAQTAGLLDV